MKLPIIDLKCKKLGEQVLPRQFNEEYRPDLIQRAVQALQSSARQSYGNHPEAGKRSSSKTSKRRRKYRGTYGFGISRVRRKILSRRGTRFSWVGAFSAQTVGGKRAHPPKANRIWERKINQKENSKAIRSALGAVLNRNIVGKRGHHIPELYPFVIEDHFEILNKTAAVKSILVEWGFQDELARSAVKKVRAGRGKLRNRKYRRKKGLLIVVGQEDCAVLKSAKNIPGLDIVPVNSLNVELLAPGALPGRVTLWTKSAIEKMGSERLFV